MVKWSAGAFQCVAVFFLAAILYVLAEAQAAYVSFEGGVGATTITGLLVVAGLVGMAGALVALVVVLVRR